MVTALKDGIILSVDEVELLSKLCLPSKLACQGMGISGAAFRMKVKRLANKFGVENTRSLIVKAIKLGYIPINLVVYREFNGD